MRRIFMVLISLGLFLAGSAFAREIEDGKLLVYVTKDGKYKVGDIIGDKVTFYGVVGDKWQTAHDKGKDLVGLLLKKGDNATAEEKHIIYVTAHNMKPPIPAYIEIDGKEQEIVEAAPAVAPQAPADAAAPQPAAAPATDATAPVADPNKH